MNELLEQLKQHTHNQKYCSARGLGLVSGQAGIAPEVLAQGLVAFLVVFLELSSWNYFVANSILIFYPAVVTYVFPEERSTRDLLLVYWSCFGLLTAFDRFLEPMPLYYVMKLCLLALFFLHPFDLAEKIQRFIEEKLEEHNLLTRSELINICRRTGRSPPPAKPAETAFSSMERTAKDSLKVLEEFRTAQGSETSTARLPIEEKTNTARLPVIVKEKMTTARLPVKLSKVEAPQEPPKAEVPPQEQPKVEEQAQPGVQPEAPKEAEKPPKIEESPKAADRQQKSTRSEYIRTPAEELYTASSPNPMLTDSSYRLRSDTGTDNREIGLTTNLHDLLFCPMDCIIFNAPFDFDDLTYHMKVKNNSKHRIAYAIKGNCIPHVLAMPPHGLLRPGEVKVVAVTVRKFEWNEFDYNKERIAYDYVLLKDDDPSNTFSHKMLQKTNTKRRKNIKILYNP